MESFDRAMIWGIKSIIKMRETHIQFLPVCLYSLSLILKFLTHFKEGLISFQDYWLLSRKLKACDIIAKGHELVLFPHSSSFSSKESAMFEPG